MDKSILMAALVGYEVQLQKLQTALNSARARAGRRLPLWKALHNHDAKCRRRPKSGLPPDRKSGGPLSTPTIRNR